MFVAKYPPELKTGGNICYKKYVTFSSSLTTFLSERKTERIQSKKKEDNNETMKRNIVRDIIVYLSVLIGGLGLVAGTWLYVKQAEKRNAEKQKIAAEQAQKEAAQSLPKVKVVEVMPIPFTDYLILPGTVKAHADIDLAAKAGGTVKWIGPKEGDRVKEGEKLLEVDVKSQTTRVTDARARYDQAVKDYERTKKLYNENIVSKGQLDNAETALQTAKAGLDSAGLTVDDGSLASPISGILDQVNVDKGENINIGQVVMKIVDIDKVTVELPVPEKDILYFKKGQAVKITVEKTNGEKIEFPGVIGFVSLTAEQATRTYLVKVTVNNSDQTLRPGMIVRAHLVRRQLEAAIAVPFFSIIDREDGKGVFIIDGDIAKSRMIEYGAFQQGLVEVRSGLNIGEKLAIVGQRNLVDGAKVIVEADVTPLAKQWIQAGKDLSQLPADLLQQ
jgi:membrane fusion protein (multidrug efflux system)